MKKLLLIISVAVVTSGLTAFALGGFTDSDSFPDWASDSIESISNMGVIQGYDDGSFRANDSVSRGELAVMLARFEKQMRFMTEEKVFNLLIALDGLGYLDTSDGYYVILAEAGYKRMPSAPDFMEDLTEDVDVDLPEGYISYSMPYSTYLKFDGFRNFGQDGWEVEEWYGPFSSYINANPRNPMSFFYQKDKLDLIED